MTAPDPAGTKPILELRDVVATRAGAPVDLVLRPGELVLVDAELPVNETALVDVALGLATPLGGSVRFRGFVWDELPPVFADALRGRVGLVPRRGGWVPELSTMANVLLQARYHRRTPGRVLADRAERLANRFFLPGVPLDAVDAMHPRDRLRAACVRAFLADPVLVIVETPVIGGWGSLVPPLVETIQEVRDAGGAVVWFLTESDLFDEPSLPADRRLRLVGASRGQGALS
ncbi:MAG: organic solvent ABC transporter ATP-binding protein [Pseudomonadota bacterium]